MPPKFIYHKQPLTCERDPDFGGWAAPGGSYADLGTEEAEQYSEIELRMPPDRLHLSWVTAHAMVEGDEVAQLSDEATQAIVATLEPHCDLLTRFAGDQA